MHIGIVTSEFPPDVGGVETYAVEFAKALVTCGHRVDVFVGRHHDTTCAIEGLTLHPVLAYAKRIDAPILQRYKVDAWHVMNAAHSWLALETDKPVVVSIHGNDFLNPYPLTGSLGIHNYRPFWRFSSRLKPVNRWLAQMLTRRLLPRSLPAARVILSNSQYTEDVFLAKFPQCRGRTVVAQVGVGDCFLNSEISPKTNAKPQLLSVARLSEPRKNIGRVLDALQHLNHEFDFNYTVVGEGPLKTNLQAQAKSLGLENKTSFIGRLPLAGVIAKMHGADLFILPSSILADSHEGFGIVYLEAAACGTPSLATRQAGAIEAIHDGKSGFFVEEPTVDQLVTSLRRFLSNSTTFRPDECRQFARQFSWQKVVEKALPYYE
ncbi:MAG: glycosyltransferase family 4 protein [Candidatus Reddybacter sp.]